MKLHTAKASPFGRKAWIAILHHGLGARIAQVDADFTNPADSIHQLNPLGKMPALLTDDAQAIYDSSVIMEYLDHLLDGALIPTAWPARLAELQIQALADGVMDAGALIVYEGRLRPPEKRHQSIIETQRGKIRAGVAAIARTPPEPTRVQLAAISVACALGFLDRRGQFNWRSAEPTLVNWLEAFRGACPAYDQTYIAPDPTWVCP